MTEAQFGSLLALWKECERHGLTMEQMYHISEIIRSFDHLDTAIDMYRARLSRDDLLLNNGVPVKMSLYSNGICFGPCPKPDRECIQRVTVSAAGKVYITLKNYQEKTLRKERKSIPSEKAAAWLGNVNMHLYCVLDDRMWVTDVGSWEAEIVNEQNSSFRVSASLTKGDRWLDRYSDELREMLGMPELYLFDGESRSGIELCSCEFELGGKQYYYRTDDKSICIGDRVLVPVGNNGDTKVVRVVDIEWIDQADLPMEIEKIKMIICKAENDTVE